MARLHHAAAPDDKLIELAGLVEQAWTRQVNGRDLNLLFWEPLLGTTSEKLPPDDRLAVATEALVSGARRWRSPPTRPGRGGRPATSGVTPSRSPTSPPGRSRPCLPIPRRGLP